MFHRFPQLLRKDSAPYRFYRGFLLAVLCAFHSKFPKHHFRVFYEIGIDRMPLRCRAKLHPARLLQGCPVTFLEE